MYTRIFLTLLALVLGIVPLSAHAARFFVEVSPAAVRPGESAVAHVYLDTEGDNANTFAGRVVFPSRLFSLEGVRDGNSIVNVWIERPAMRGGGHITFSGMTPGGYSGGKGLLLSIALRAESEGEGAIIPLDVQAFRNDGEGTEIVSSASESRIAVSAGAPSSGEILPEDATPPEPFVPELVRDAEAYEGRTILVFATQDKGLGMRGYEVCEGFLAPCVSAESPFVLQNQKTDGVVVVRAIDNAGNERVYRLYTSAAKMWYLLALLLGIVVCVAVRYAFRWMRTTLRH
jgi:hypothetical protein